MINIRKLETELLEAADLLRADSKVTSQEYCMPVLGLIFLRYAYSRFKFVEADILKDRPVRNGRVLPVEADDFKIQTILRNIDYRTLAAAMFGASGSVVRKFFNNISDTLLYFVNEDMEQWKGTEVEILEAQRKILELGELS